MPTFLECLFLSGFLTKILYEISSPIYATCSTYLILLDLITLIKFGDVYKI
jgi:hypothetical protein